MYKTPPTVARKGLSTLSVSLAYSPVVSAWEAAGGTDTERKTGDIPLCT